MSFIADAESDAHLRETRLSSEIVYSGSFLQVQRDTVSLPDGKTSTREFIRHPGAVVIMPLFDDGTVLLERQYRHPVGQIVVEFPAGKIDAGEDVLTCAQRELQEETGYSASNWRFVCSVHNALGYSDEKLEFFMAQDLVEGQRCLEEGELIETFRLPLETLLEWVQTGRVTDVKTIIGAFWLQKYMNGEWSQSSTI